MSQLTFQTEKYTFEFIQERISVLIKIKLVEELAHARDITDEDVEEIRKFLGYWEVGNPSKDRNKLAIGLRNSPS